MFSFGCGWCQPRLHAFCPTRSGDSLSRRENRSGLETVSDLARDRLDPILLRAGVVPQDDQPDGVTPAFEVSPARLLN